MTKQIGAITLYSTEEISNLLGVGQAEIKNLIEKEILFGRKVAGRWMISEDSIRTFFDAPEKQTININLDLGQYWEKLIGQAEVEKTGGHDSPKIILMKKLADATPASGFFSPTASLEKETPELEGRFELREEIETINEFELADEEQFEEELFDDDEFDSDEGFKLAEESEDYSAEESFAGPIKEQEVETEQEIRIIEVSTSPARAEQFSMPLEIDLESGTVISDPSEKPIVSETCERTSAQPYSLEIDLTEAS